MGNEKTGRLTIRDLRSGRNNVDPPQSIADTHCVTAINVDWFNASFARKRFGVTQVTLTSSPFTGTYSSMFRHVPTTDETAAELWATDDAGTPNVGRLTGGTVWATPTLKDVPTGNGWEVTYASLNGKLFIAYKSAVDRLHVWDPVTNAVRRTGLAIMAVPTVADQGAGAYAAVLRYYRTRVTEQRAGITVRRSEPSPSVAFTPSGANGAARVTQGALPGEVETHWEVEASTDNATFYRIATVVIGTTTYDDSAVTTSYASNPLSASAGTYVLQKSYRFLAADQGRILGFGAFTTTNPQSRIEYSSVLGSSDIGDDERVPTGNYLGLDENDSGSAVGIKGPINGSFFAAKYRQIWKLTPTGSVVLPYSLLCLSKVVGATNHQAMTVAEDEAGRPILAWMSSTGPYRLGVNGPEYIGKGVEDYTIGSNGVSLSLETAKVLCHVQWFRDLRQMWFWVAIGGNTTDPTVILVATIGRTSSADGTDPGLNLAWSVFDGGIGTARCSTMFSTPIAASMTRTLYPYIGSTANTNKIGVCNVGLQDFGSNFLSSIRTKVYEPWGDNFFGSVTGAQLVAIPSSNATLTVTMNADFGFQTVAESVSLAAIGTESRVQPRIGGALVLGDIQTVQFSVGDSGTTSDHWQVDELGITFRKNGMGTS